MCFQQNTVPKQPSSQTPYDIPTEQQQQQRQQRDDNVTLSITQRPVMWVTTPPQPIHRLAWWLCILTALTTVCHAKIEDSYINKDERRVIVVSSPFGFTEAGIVDILVTKFLDYKPSDAATPDLEKMGFLLAPSESETQLDMDLLQGNCPLSDNPGYTKLFTLKEVLGGGDMCGMY